MASFTWAAPVGGDWNVAANWVPAVVPNDALADVTIDNPTAAAYQVTIAAGENQTVRSLTMNAVNDLAGSNRDPYTAAQLAVNGTLTFGAGSPGLLGGSLQTFVTMVNGTIVNPGTVNGFIQGQGNVLLTGTNGFYVTNWLQSLAGIVTIDTKSITEITGNTLFDGIYEAKGPGAIINLGGPRQNLIVNVATIEGPPLIPDGWTELILNGTLNDIGEWNGARYVPIESTLKDIASRGTFDIIGGRDYNTANTLTIEQGGLLNLQAGTVTTGLLNINGGTVQGSGTINSGVINNGTLRAVDGLLSIGTGGLVGSGFVAFDFDQKFGTIAPSGLLEVHGVGPGQTFIMNGTDTLVMDTPVSFAGTIIAKPGDTFLLGGITATSATLQGQSLLVQNAGQTVKALNLAGNYAGDVFTVSPFGVGSTQIKVTGPARAALDGTTGAALVTPSSAAIAPVVGPQDQYAPITTASLDLSATTPKAFLAAGSDQAAGDMRTDDVVDAGSGSKFLTAGSGNDQFVVDVRNLTTDIFSTIANFHPGDSATILGVTLPDFTVHLSDNAGAPGFTGLNFAFDWPGQPTANLVLPGYSIADLTGRLSQTLGTIPDPSGGPGTPFLTISSS